MGKISSNQKEASYMSLPTASLLETVVALHNYSSTEESCLSFLKGDLLQVHQKDASGWWDGTLGKKRGWFPSNYVQVVQPAPARKSAVRLAIDTKTQNSESSQNSLQSSAPIANQDYKKDDKNVAGVAVNSSELPRFWGKKVTSQGQVYFYNSNTNQTTFNISDVHSTMTTLPSPTTPKLNSRISRDFRDSTSKRMSAARPKSIIPHSWSTSTSNSSLAIKADEVSWEMLINNILRSISDLNQAAKTDFKSSYITLSNQIVIAIRDMMACSGCISKNLNILNENKQLKHHHRHIMGSLSRLVLTSKIASGIWPPPDAVNKMRYQAGQVLLAIRHFVSLAQEFGLELQPPLESSFEEFNIKGAELSEIEFISKLDSYSESIIKCITQLSSTVKSTTTNTQEAESDNWLLTQQSIIDDTRKVVTEIGQFLSLIEEIHISNTLLGDQEALLDDFKGKKDFLYTSVNDLVTCARTTMDSNAPSDTLLVLMETTTTVSKYVEEVSMAAKLIVDQEELIQVSALAQEADKIEMEKKQESEVASPYTSDSPGESVAEENELESLQKSALSLNFKNEELHKLTASESTGSTSDRQSLFQTQRSTRSLDEEDQPSSPLLTTERIGKISKLEKMMGHEVKERDVTAWYLKYDYNTADLSFNMEGQVNGGTLYAFVERATIHDMPVGTLILT